MYTGTLNTRFSEKVSRCDNWKQLLHVALAADEANEPYEKGIYYSSYRFCSAELLNQKLKEVKGGRSNLETITRNYGLRDKVVELLTNPSPVKHRKINAYRVDYHQSGCFPALEYFPTVREARKAASAFISDIRNTCTSQKGFRKIGNLKNGFVSVEHLAFGREASVYISRNINTGHK